MSDPIAHICSGWCNHPDIPTVIVTLAYLDKLRAAGVTLAPTPPDALDVCPDCGVTRKQLVLMCKEHLMFSVTLAPTPPDALREADADKLRVLATWFDDFDDWREATNKIAPGIAEYREVQNDLRRIAAYLAATPAPLDEPCPDCGKPSKHADAAYWEREADRWQARYLATLAPQPDTASRHEWTTNDKYDYEWCRICLKVRQANGSSDAKPCKGPARVTLRDQPDTASRELRATVAALPMGPGEFATDGENTSYWGDVWAYRAALRAALAATEETE